MKAFLWSFSLHLLLLGLLAYHHFSPTEAAKLKPAPPILAYAYQSVQAKAAPPVKAEVSPAVVKTAEQPKARVQAPKAAAVTKKVQPQKKAKPAPPKKAKTVAAQAQKKPFVPVRKPAMVKPQRKPFVPVRKPAMVKPLPKPIAVAAAKPLPVPEPVKVAAKPLPVPEPVKVAAAKPLPVPEPVKVAAAKPLPVPEPVKVTAATPVPAPQPIKVTAALPSATATQPASTAVDGVLDNRSSMANKSLQAAKQGDGSGSASWKDRQQQLALEITQAKAQQKPETGRKVKTFADGSALIDTNPGCWKVPPAESRKGAIWLSTSVPCKKDTTAEQIDAILQKRRSYSKD